MIASAPHAPHVHDAHAWKLLALALLLAAIGLALLPRPAHTASSNLKVVVTGLSGAPEENVEAILDPAGAGHRGKLTDVEVRRMHEQAPQLIRTAMQPYGYYRPIITGELTQQKGAWVAHYDVEPGPPLTLDSVVVRMTGEGATDPAIARAAAEFPLHRGDVLNQAAYERGKEAIIKAASKGGFIDARFSDHAIQVNLAQYTSAIVLRYDTGPRYHFGEIHFDQDILDPAFLRGYAPWHAGDPLDLSKLLEMQLALGQSPYFSDIQVRADREHAQGTDVPIEVVLAPTRRQHYTGGLGYGTDNGAHVSGGLEVRRLNRRGHTLDVQLQTSRPESNGSIGYHVPFPYPATDVITLGLEAGEAQYIGQLSRRASVGLSWSRMLGVWRRGLGFEWRQERYVVASDSGTARTLEPQMSWSWTRADDRLFTRHGQRLTLDARGAARGMLSNASYAQVDVTGKWIRSLTETDRIIWRAELGATGTRDFRRLPRTRRFFAGGAQSVRGFNYESLGPRDAIGVLGGPFLEVASIEMDHWFMRRFGVAAFFDAGNAMSSTSGELAEALGPGLHMRSPIGLLRADMAFPIAPHGRRPVFHLGLGPEL